MTLSTILAQTIDVSPTSTGLADVTIYQIIQWAVTVIIIVAGIIFFFMLILGGIRWMLSGGDKANTESARNQITAALIGLIIVFAAWAIIQLLQSLFGITIFGNLTIPTITEIQ